MKIQHLLPALFATCVAFSSCNLDSDEQDNVQTFNLPCSNLVIPADGETFATSASYSLAFYYLSENMTLSTANLSLGTGGAFGFTSTKMPYTSAIGNFNGNTAGINSFSGGKANENGLQIQNIKGYTTTFFNVLNTGDPVNNDYKWVSFTPLVLTYTANYDYTVKTFMADAIYTGNTMVTSVGVNEAPYANDGIRYRIVFQQDYKKADVIFYNAKFAEAMPITINFILKDLDVKYNKSGYVISGNNITPLLNEGNSWTPAPGFPFSSFEFINTSDNLTSGSAMYTVQVFGKPYSCTFNGYYCLTDPKEK